MSSPNVDKMLLTLNKESALALELQLALAKIEDAAEVSLTKAEKAEFLKALGDETGAEGIHFAWT